MGEILFKGLLLGVFLVILRFIGRAFSSVKEEFRNKLPNENKKIN